MIIAHRGFAEKYTENTVSAVRQSDSIADVVEIDIRETADNQFVVRHDSTVPVGHKQKQISNVEYSTLITDAHTQTQPLTDFLTTDLSSVLLIETKGKIDIQSLISEINSINSTVEVWIQSFHPKHIRDLVTADWNGKYGLLVPTEDLLNVHGVPRESITDVLDAISFANQTDCSFLSMYYESCTPEVLSLCEENEIDLYGWTVRDSETANKLQKVGIDGIITDHPKYCLE